jgi:glycosyltransferase involved in cell wall biosynthesis
LLAVFRLRLRRRIGRGGLDPGVTVVIANWQTTRFLEGTVAEVLRRSPPGTRVVVVDNCSTGADRARLRGLPQAVRVVRLPVNVGHGVALDIAAMLASSRLIVALDADAFPISDSWIERLERPLQEGRTVSGAGGSAGQIAPCCLMISLERFIRSHHSFTSRFVPGNESWLRPERVWDVGRSISIREGAASLHRVERTAYLDEARQIGEVFGDVVYPNGYATVGLAPSNRGTVTSGDALSTWRIALARYSAGPGR